MSAQLKEPEPQLTDEEWRKWHSQEAIEHFRAKYQSEPVYGWDEDSSDE